MLGPIFSTVAGRVSRHYEKCHIFLSFSILVVFFKRSKKACSRHIGNIKDFLKISFLSKCDPLEVGLISNNDTLPFSHELCSGIGYSCPNLVSLDISQISSFPPGRVTNAIQSLLFFHKRKCPWRHHISRLWIQNRAISSPI